MNVAQTNSFRPHFPRSFLARPEFVQILIFAVGVHGIEESVVAIGHELTFTRQPFQRLAFEDALRTAEIIEYAPVKDEKTGTDQARGLGLLHEALHLSARVGFEDSEARYGRHRRDRCQTAMLAVELQ